METIGTFLWILALGTACCFWLALFFGLSKVIADTVNRALGREPLQFNEDIARAVSASSARIVSDALEDTSIIPQLEGVIWQSLNRYIEASNRPKGEWALKCDWLLKRMPESETVVKVAQNVAKRAVAFGLKKGARDENDSPDSANGTVRQRPSAN